MRIVSKRRANGFGLGTKGTNVLVPVTACEKWLVANNYTLKPDGYVFTISRAMAKDERCI